MIHLKENRHEFIQYFDANPSLAPITDSDCWPGALINEAAEGTSQLYNCEFVVVDRRDFTLEEKEVLNTYPHLTDGNYILMVEVMCTKGSVPNASGRTSRSCNDGQWYDLLAPYTKFANQEKSVTKFNYAPKEITFANCQSGKINLFQ
jgi:hypothetical protein